MAVGHEVLDLLVTIFFKSPLFWGEVIIFTFQLKNNCYWYRRKLPVAVIKQFANTSFTNLI
jgi:hypothetical protein